MDKQLPRLIMMFQSSDGCGPGLSKPAAMKKCWRQRSHLMPSVHCVGCFRYHAQLQMLRLTLNLSSTHV